MRVFLATWLEDSQGESLTKAKGEHRLLSYFFVREKGKKLFDLIQYVDTGRIQYEKRKR
jgi:hypothetical protein